MKSVSAMTAVELLSEFTRVHEYHESVSQARAWMCSDEAKSWAEDFEGPYTKPVEDGRGKRWLWLKKIGRPLDSVREPSPREEQRWTELCTEINRRFDAKEREP